jgi:serine/threonine protein kinase
MTDHESKSLLGYSPNYSPLEQIQSTGTDARSDLYSLGATLYHLLTGAKPKDALTRATAVVNGQPDPLRPPDELDREIAVPLSTALMRAMALNIENRPRTAYEMRDDLHDTSRRAAPTIPIIDAGETTRVSLPAKRAEVIAPEPAPNRERGRQVVVPVPEETFVARKQSGSGRKWIMGALLIAGLIAISAVLYLLLSGNDTNEPA